MMGGGQQRPLGLCLGPGTCPGLGLSQAGEVSYLSFSGSSQTKGNLDVILNDILCQNILALSF